MTVSFFNDLKAGLARSVRALTLVVTGVAALMGLSAPGASWAADDPLSSPAYRLILLEGAGVGAASKAMGINDAGQVVGYTEQQRWFGIERHAVLWDAGGMVVLGAGNDSMAYGINNQSQVVGTSAGQAALWQSGNESLLASPGGYSAASAINEAGQIVGGSGQGAMLWEGGGYTVLASLGGTSGWANDINEAGQIVGYSEGPGNGFAHATLWDNGAVIDLDPTGSYSTAEGINDQGQVVGSREFGWQAMRWADGTGVVLNDAYATWGLAINSHGVAVGGEVDGNTLGDLALMWGADGAETALSSLVDPSQAILFRAQDINDRGWIAGYALNSQTQLTQAFVLIPVPEPETLVLLMSGLAMLLAIAARRKSRPL